MKIIAAIDKFKGSLTSLEAADAIRQGISRAFSKNNSMDLEYQAVEIADGGDGSASALQSVKHDAKSIDEIAADPLGHEMRTSYLLYSGSFHGEGLSLNPNGADRCAFIEMAKISGLELVPASERNPLIATTYGLGQLVMAAYRSGAKKIILSVGGSATNDGGTGMLQALGFGFYNRQGELITDYMCGGLLGDVGKIALPQQGSEGAELLSGLKNGECEIEVVCDVTNPLLGENGATMVYGPQKGADSAKLQQLERGMENLAAVVSGEDSPICPQRRNLHLQPGAGAAGGVGFAVNAFLNGRIISGWRFFAGITNLEEKIASADLVISGEGRIDTQSLSGKVIDGVLALADKYDKPVWLFCGVNSLQEVPAKIKIFQLADLEPDIEKCKKNATALLERLACIHFSKILQ